MNFLPALLLAIFKAPLRPQGGRAVMNIIIRRPHAYLEAAFRRAFEGEENVKVILDRRYDERRMGQQAGAVERRRADRRRPKEEIGELAISD